MSKVTFYRGQQLPLEMHKVRIIEADLLPIEQRLATIVEPGTTRSCCRTSMSSSTC